MAEFYGVQRESTRETPTMLRVIRICRKCGAKNFADAPEGLCARCMLKIALAMPPEVAGVARGSSAVGSAMVDDGRSTENVGGAGQSVAPDSKNAARTAELLGDLGDHEMLGEGGRRGQGVVFRAPPTRLNRPLALK